MEADRIVVRLFWPVTLVLLAVLAAAQLASILQESQTYDEATHLAAGYSYLTTGDYRLNAEHPPLSKMLAALPLLFLKPHLPVEDASWKNGDGLYFGAIFLYLNRMDAEKMLFRSHGRYITNDMPIAAFGLCLGDRLGRFSSLRRIRDLFWLERSWACL